MHDGIAYHDRFGEEDVWLIPANSIGRPTSDDRDDSLARRIGQSLLDWAGLASDGERANRSHIEQFAERIEHSSIPEACRAIASALADSAD